MNRYFIIGVLLLFVLRGYTQEEDKKIWKINLDQVEVSGQRKFEDVGATKTKIDTVVLRESVTNSLADVLSQSTSVFIKNYGRGTQATASFRGTAPSHTQVLWNGMKVNSPMLGQVDFSLIPSYFIDEMSLWHGASSINVAGGGLGGAITLGNKKMVGNGSEFNFIQGVSSFRTYDEFLHYRLAKGRFQTSTRIAYVNSKNDFEYVNYNKRNFDFSGDGGITYPTERNKNCNYRDLHVLQELYYDIGMHKFSLAAWYMDSRRGIPMLNVNYREDDESKSQQEQKTLRVAGQWERLGEKVKMSGNVGYTFDNTLYTYRGELGTGGLAEMQNANSIVYTGFLKYGVDYFPSEKWMFSANLSSNFHSVSSYEKTTKTGYDRRRPEASALAVVRYRPLPRLGFALNVREDYYGKWTPIIPAGFVDVVLWPAYGVILKGSVARNYHYPSLNDLYFLPGGNPELKTENGFTYDGGVEFTIKKDDRFSFSGEVSAYDSYIDDWIIWLPTYKGFWEPKNVKQVHSYGWELKGKSQARLGGWTLYINANWAQTRSINNGDPMNWADESIGKQLVYIPEFSSGVMGRLGWKEFIFTYKYNYFSERFTTSSNEMHTKIGSLGSYYMNDISLEKRFRAKAINFTLKLSVYNLFDEEYVSVLSRPMAGRNYGFFVGINPKWGQHAHPEK